jgi:hypothetical protein
VLLRVLVPAGFMLAPQGQAFALVPCPQVIESAPVAKAAHHHHSPAKHDPAKHGAKQCPFSALAAVALPPTGSAEVAAPLQAEFAPEMGLETQVAVPELAAPPPPSRGPPILS